MLEFSRGLLSWTRAQIAVRGCAVKCLSNGPVNLSECLLISSVKRNDCIFEFASALGELRDH